MILYNVIRNNVTPTVNTDFLTITTNATRSIGILEIDAEGGGTASAYTEVGVFRVSALGVTPVAITTATTTPISGVVPVNSASPANGFTVATGWTTQPTVSSPVHSFPINANGQRYFWRAMPNLSNAIWVPGGGASAAAGQLSFRPTVVSGAMSVRVQVGEI